MLTALAMLASLLGLASPAAAVATTGSITGVVSNSAGTHLAGVSVTAESAFGIPGVVVTTATDGTYTLAALPSGSYRVRFDAPGTDLVTQYYNGATSLTATSVVVAAGDVRTGIDAILAAGSSITGKVTGPDGAPVVAVSVSATRGLGSGESPAFASTDANGVYTIHGVVAGSYSVYFSGTGVFAPEYYSNANTAAAAVAVVVTLAGPKTGIDAQLAVGGSIAGTVTGVGGAALVGIYVAVQTGNGNSRVAWTDDNGDYLINALAAGSYTVEFYSNTSNFVSEYYDNKTYSSATLVAVALGATTASIDAELITGGSIAGTIKDSAGKPIAGVSVYAQSAGVGGYGYSEADGSYVIEGLATGSYQVSFSDYTGTFATQTAASVAVVAGSRKSGVDAVLTRAATLSGKVTGPGGAAVAGVSVYLTASSAFQSGSATTGADGTYTVKGLVAGSYSVRFTAPTGVNLIGKTLAAVPVATSATVTGVDAELTVGGTITGVVTDSSGSPMAGVSVQDRAPVNDSTSISTQTAADGSYTITGLQAGTHQVYFSGGNDSDLIPEYYDDAATMMTAAGVVVTVGTTTAHIDAKLAAGASFSGTVRGPGGAPVANVSVMASPRDDPSGASVGTQSASDGSFTLRGLRAGIFAVAFSVPSDVNLVSAYYGDVYTAAAATPVVATAGAAKLGIDAHLVAGATISGVVTGPGNTGEAGISVQAETDDSQHFFRTVQTAADGSYSVLGLAAGSYTLRFNDWKQRLLSEYYDDVTTRADAIPVVVSSGAVRTGINAKLAVGATIAGTVTGPDNKPVAGVSVYASDDSADGTSGYAQTGADGTYVVAGLRPTPYVVQFTPPSASGLLTEYYTNAADSTGAKRVTPVVGTPTTGINAKLELGGSIHGTVTGPDGKPVAGVGVQTDGYSIGASTSTAADGTYTLSGLVPGDATVAFRPTNEQNLVREYWKDSATESGATPVRVVSGVTVSSVDAALVAGASIVGSVTRPAGMVMACVDAWPVGSTQESYPSSSTCTDVAGYSLNGLAAGSYIVEFTANDYLGTAIPTYYQGAQLRANAKPVKVETQKVTPAINGTLAFAGAAISTVALSVSPTAPAVGTPTTVTAKVTGGTTVPTGVAEFWGYDSTISEVALVNGVATLTKTFSSATEFGGFGVTYRGDTTHSNGFGEIGFVVTDHRVATTTTVTSSPSPSSAGAEVTLTAQVKAASGAPSGLITFRDGARLLGTGTIVAGKATLKTTALAVDTHAIKADYAGSAVHGVSSGGVSHVVAKATTTTALVAAPSASIPGGAVAMTATVASDTTLAGVPTGAVVFSVGTTVLGTVGLVGGKATLSVTTLPLGTATVSAKYQGSATHAASTGTTAHVVAAPAVPSITGLSPATGQTTGGTVVLITGTGFAGATSVKFGDLAAARFTVLSATQISATSPAHARGDLDIRVATSAGTSPVVTAARFAFLDFVGVPPVRALSNPVVAPSAVQCMQIAGTNGVPLGATSVAMNVTTVHPNAQGYVVVYPDTDGNGATPAPGGSTVNFDPGADVANSAFIKLPANGKVCYATKGATKVGVLFDVTGFTVAGSGIETQSSERLLDTRAGSSHVGTVTGPLTPRKAIGVTVAGKANVPAGATGVLLNVTVTGARTMGNLRVYPEGESLPNASVVNYAPGKTKANATIVALPTNGRISLYSDTSAGVAVNPINVILDVVGYIVPGSSYTPVTPSRLMDTRPSLKVGSIAGPLTAKTVYSLLVAGVGKVPADAAAVVLNVTAIGPSSLGNLRVYPDSDGTKKSAPPTASTINYVPGSDTPNLVVVSIPADGRIDFYSDQGAGGTVQVAADVIGYIAGK